jgi:predicted dehydrogenase
VERAGEEMEVNMSEQQKGKTLNRREFVGAAAATGLMILKPELVKGSQRNSAVRLALFGCGGRGTSVTTGFATNTTAQIIALGDLFEDPIVRAKTRLDKALLDAGKTRIPAELAFMGPDALNRLVASDQVDAVYIATPPCFHVDHLDTVVNSGKHVYVEKPVAVDAPGCRRTKMIGQKADGKLSLAVGFQIRHASPYVEMVKRIRSGEIGDIVSGLCHYYASALELRPYPGIPAETLRVRHWIHDRVLSGDIIVEQNVHIIDVNNWVLQSLPIKASGDAGRHGRRDNGDCSSHFECVYTYPNDVSIAFASTQFIKGDWHVANRYFGTDGNAESAYAGPVRITGDNPWHFPGLGGPGTTANSADNAAGAFSGALDDADAKKQQNFIQSIVSGQFLNEAEHGANSTLSGILGRTAAYAQRTVTWEEVENSQETWHRNLDISTMG